MTLSFGDPKLSHSAGEGVHLSFGMDKRRRTCGDCAYFVQMPSDSGNQKSRWDTCDLAAHLTGIRKRWTGSWLDCGKFKESQAAYLDRTNATDRRS